MNAALDWLLTDQGMIDFSVYAACAVLIGFAILSYTERDHVDAAGERHLKNDRPAYWLAGGAVFVIIVLVWAGLQQKSIACHDAYPNGGPDLSDCMDPTYDHHSPGS